MLKKIINIFFGSKPTTTHEDVKAAHYLVNSMNQALKIANESSNISVRESSLATASNQLEELKELVSLHPAISIKRLTAFETSINKVEAETKEMKNNNIAVQCKEPQKQFTQNNEEVVISMIQNQFKVINESIKIARDSKNLDTKTSRLGVARNALSLVREQASQFNIDVDVDGLEKAEAAINEIDVAIKNGLPTSEIVIPDIPDYYSSPARELLKKATALKKDKKYTEACEMLQNAYLSEGANDLMIEERLRLPMYLLLAGKNDEGWEELNRLNSFYRDDFSQPVIANQMRVFCKKEGGNRTPLLKPILELKEPKVEKINESGFEISSGKPFEAYSQNQDLYDRLEFHATLQFRTPLRILSKHGARHKDPNRPPPDYAKEMWEGIWVPVTKTWRELGFDIDEIEFTSASNIGLIKRSEYLPFLIALREAVEMDESIDERVTKLQETLSDKRWDYFKTKHGGADKLVNEFFPRFIETIPKLNYETINELASLKIDTPNQIANTPDDLMLKIKGIGKAKLNTIRDYCVSISEDRDSIRLDKVTR